MVRTIIYDKHTVLPVSHWMNGEYGIKDVCVSMPVVVGRGGIISRLCINITDEEAVNLRKSATVIAQTVASVN